MILAEKRRTGDVQYSMRNILLKFVFRIIRMASPPSRVYHVSRYLGKSTSCCNYEKYIKGRRILDQTEIHFIIIIFFRLSIYE